MEQKRTLQEYLKQLRKSRSYRQEDIALYLNVSRQTYSHYETGRIKPSINVLYQLAKFYGVSTDDILKHINLSESEQEPEENRRMKIDKKNDAFLEKEFLSCLRSLSEEDREDTLAIMWEIMQAKIMKREAETIKT